MHDYLYPWAIRSLLFAASIGLCGYAWLSDQAFAGSPSPSMSSDSGACERAEDCFQAAAMPKERLGKTLNKEQVLSLKIDRLQRVMERFPATLWAKRAGLLSGVLLLERNPAVAIQFLRAAQRDFPTLDDYIRLWTGEALLNFGNAKEAADMFESIPQAVPDSYLLTKAAYRAGEAWYQASSCLEATAWFAKAVELNDKEPGTPRALLRRSACQLRDNNIREGRETLMQLWVRFAYSAEAKEAEALLASNLGGEPWVVQPSERLARAQAYLGQSFHAEAIEELRKFLAADPQSPRRAEAKLKLGIAQVRLKQYDEARETFRALVKDGGTESREASVWLARVYLRQGQGDKLLDLARQLATSSLSAEQKGQITLFAGMWLEDQYRFDEAIERYRQVAKVGEPVAQRAEARWRVGWVHYRLARYREVGDELRQLGDQNDSDFEPQALYWMGRAAELSQQPHARDVYMQLCRQYVYTYYCQLARERIDIPLSEPPASEQISATAPVNGGTPMNGEATRVVSTRAEIEQQSAYRRAIELKTLGLESDAARELAGLTDRYSRDPDALMALATLLNEVGAYHHALRLARARFRDKLERTGGIVDPSLWKVAYPTGLLPMIKGQGANGVDPYLVAAIIREESQYDRQAVSRVGAIGLMQVMPGTANNVAQRLGLPAVSRDDLFDQETNIQIGVRYVEQLLEQFSGNVAFTVASYNAGPIVVKSWIALHPGRSQDEFIELIPYQETRQYVKRVLRSYREYLRLDKAS
ncbi:MAG TPA: transglycosylase SLT domain-containing protein [Nitrospiraceae bacterium]|nr:transglycosylase SLT domain-containing protein [Nitrospiraceae bacterium]